MANSNDSTERLLCRDEQLDHRKLADYYERLGTRLISLLLLILPTTLSILQLAAWILGWVITGSSRTFGSVKVEQII
jgi:predicted component of type VI protein secretion system